MISSRRINPHNFKMSLRYDSFLVAFLPFLYGLANIFTIVGSITAGIVILAICAILPSIFLQVKRWIYSLSLLGIFILIILLQLPFYPHNSAGILSTLISLCSLGFFGLYVGSSKYNISLVIDDSKKLALINFLINIIYLIKNSDDIEILSMRFGYGILPSVMFFLLFALTERSYKYWILSFFGLFLLFIWGSRGCLGCIVIFFLMYIGRNHLGSLIICGIGILFLRNVIIDILIWCIDQLPFETYKLNKMLTMLTSGVEAASSGRDYLYSFYLDKFIRNPEGFGIGYNTTIGMLYPHNIILQIGIEFGVIGLIIWFLYEIFVFYRIVKLNGNRYYFLSIIFAITNGRLLISSNFWERPEWWFLMALMFRSIRVTLKGLLHNKHNQQLSKVNK